MLVPTVTSHDDYLFIRAIFFWEAQRHSQYMLMVLGSVI